MNDKNTIYINKKAKKKQKIKKELSDIEENEKKLDELVIRSEECIYEAKAFFPFDLFPDKVAIDANKVTITRNYLLSSNEFPIPADKITNVEVFYGLFLGSIRFEVKGYSQNPPTCTNFTHSNLRIMKRYITGLIRAYEEEIDLTGLELKSLRAKLQRIGKRDDQEIMDHS